MKNKIAFLGSIFIIMAIFLFGIRGHVFAKESANQPKDDIIPGQYIVVLKNNVTNVDGTVSDLVKAHHATLLHSYHSIIKGFAGNISDLDLAKIKSDPRVAFVSEDRRVTYFTMTTPTQPTQIITTGVRRINASSSNNKGAGVVIAVLDTGIDASHPDLSSNILNSGTSCISGTTSDDDNGHGTHVAGIIAASNNGIGVVGVAPQAKLIPVKVLDKNGSGTWSSVICGVDWVTSHAAQYNIKIANISLGGAGTSDNNCGNTNDDALHQAICRSRDAGVIYVAAAGNSGTSATNIVPAAYDDAVITVSALVDTDGLAGGNGPSTSYGKDDTFANFSGYGSVVDLGAPGVNIFSTWIGGGYMTLSGTSMAVPHVVGAIALYLDDHPGSTWTQVRDGLISLGESLGLRHTDPSGLHPEKVLNAAQL